MVLRQKIMCSSLMELEISPEVIKAWNRYRQTGSRDEACGVLIGGHNQGRTVAYLEHCTAPQKKDQRRRCAFVLRDPFHQTHLNQVYEQADSESFYLGTWHTHPEDTPSPSRLDLSDWGNCMKRNPQNEIFVFVIVGRVEVLISIFRHGEKWKDLHDHENS